MCGICGIYDSHSTLAPIGRMNSVQRHRGPDDEGYLFIHTQRNAWQLAGGAETPAAVGLAPLSQVATDHYDLVLASRRLAILDLSPAGHMPMSDGDAQLWITYNGEIYNYRELRQELRERGHHFRSDSDTEVILAAYAEWGADCLPHLNGMFAFALWDARRRRLFCARDRFGIKPFYYHWNGELFLFASELKSLLQHPLAPCTPDDNSLFDYLALGVSDHTERTFFAEICALQPGHFLTLEVGTQTLYTAAWWQVEINPSTATPTAAEQRRVYQDFAALLEDAVRIHLRSDVAVGTALSGGLDSSTIVLLANRLLLEEAVIPRALVGEHQKTFTARNREAALDEYAYSRLVIDRTGAQEHLIYPQAEALWQELETFVWHLDEPVNSTSQYAQWNVMRLARRNQVTVLLDGQGGDEIFAGYYAYFPPYLAQLYQQCGWLTTAQAALAVARVGGAPVRTMLLDDASHRLPRHLRRVINKLRRPHVVPGGGGTSLQEWQLQPAFIQRNWERRWQPRTVDANGLVGMLYEDLTATNLPKLLRYEDRISMAFSLETRLPYLDYRLVEMVFALPLSYRIQNGWNKWILRRSMQQLLPQEICWRRTKLGYPTPETAWLQQGAPVIRQILQRQPEEQLAPYLQPGVMKQICSRPDAALAAAPGVWRLVNLALWFELFFNRSRSAWTPPSPALFL
ncbi:MAG: asparagine synthase (glutamine-hydrolyzing) [Caldilineaceae bacterium]